MKSSESIEIRQLGNGYQVLPSPDASMRGMSAILPSDVLVFQSLTELQSWLSDHFTYRGHNIKSDAAPKK